MMHIRYKLELTKDNGTVEIVGNNWSCYPDEAIKFAQGVSKYKEFVKGVVLQIVGDKVLEHVTVFSR